MKYLIMLLSFLLTSSSPDLSAVWQAAGGKDAWNETRYISFQFTVIADGKPRPSRIHLWDRYTGDYRLNIVSGPDSLTILFNTNTKKGRVWKQDSSELSDSLSGKYLDQAYRMFINDTYWLLNPVKLEDPGVQLTEVPDEEMDGESYRVLLMKFTDGTGLTSGDSYWIYISRQSGEIRFWTYLLQNQTEKRMYRWKPYESIGKIRLSLEKTTVDGSFSIQLSPAKTLDSVPETIFTNPRTQL